MPVPDPVALTQALIRCRSVTPADDGALAALEAALAPLGFRCERMRFEAPGTAPIDNLYARIGTGGPHLCFAGHTDVVPPGDESRWRFPPFEGRIEEGRIWGRGACDMKSAVAAFAAAAGRFIAERGSAFGGSISLLITGDEEAEAINGTVKVLQALASRGETIDACIVGEPSSSETVGDTMKIGRRGSLTGRLTVRGAQGHVAYPHKADNPLPRLVRMLAALSPGGPEAPGPEIDGGSTHFDPSTLAVTTIDVGNPATNVIPAEGRAVFNIRFNDTWTADSLGAWLRDRFDAVGGDYTLDLRHGADSFLTAPGELTGRVAGAVERVTGRRPAFSTSGGTSDARFVKDHAPVVELGLVNATIHKTDENVPVEEIETLTRIYRAVIEDSFPERG
ncbi:MULTISPECIES: succinyl-diaminopimelate desuccinylase [Inquilinus]|uniref:Succinyl-diaminopimelate desuccinylase n=1 Tax=Inquilinus ginsengisoli TaxID=363840 RepID=A0ABU1JM55_9PROT|nr:succinyl-diaminopimelate desuccinylase [Inquilinus ginsengisoli]MDR6288630.1 succinyl-diaminopimelate desuccinylase [Inquilinus ginsengisoli]